MPKKIKLYADIDMNYFNTAPTRIIVQQKLSCNCEQLFDIFEDASSWPIWASSISRIEWTSEKPYGIGTTRTAYLKGGMYGEETFIDWQRGKSMAFKFTRGTVPTQAFAEKYTVSAIDQDHCQLIWTVAMSPVGISRFFMPISTPILKYYLQSILRKLNNYTQQKYIAAT